MTAWITARDDTTGVGQIVAYRFPRQSTVFGPQQIEARINQEPAISSQISLLDQAGSRVILGNLLIIPIDQTILYAQPLYLQATGTGSGLAELKFVIIATNSRVVMRPTLAEALTAIGEGGAITPPPVISDQRVPDTSFPLDADGERLAAEALAAYERGEAALARGDWTAYGQEQATLEAILRQLVSPPATPPATAPTPATPEPTPAATPVSI
jgi:hypothetical protein